MCPSLVIEDWLISMQISVCGWQKEWLGPLCLKGILVRSQCGVELALSQQTDNLAVRPVANLMACELSSPY